MKSPLFSGAAIGCVLAGSIVTAAVSQPAGLWNGVKRLVVACEPGAGTGPRGQGLCRLVADEFVRRSPYPVQLLAQGAALEEARDIAVLQVRIEEAGRAGGLRLVISTRRALEIDDREGERTHPPVMLPPEATAEMPATRAAIVRAVARSLPGTAQREARNEPGPFTRHR